MIPSLSESEITDLFTQADGSYQFARWGRPIAPVVFGVNDDILKGLRAAIESTVGITGQKLAEVDPELGTNFIWIFVREWDELMTLPDIGKLIPDLDKKLVEIKKSNSNSYRYLTFDPDGAIMFACVIIRPVGDYAKQSVSVIGAAETVLTLATFGANAFKEESPLAMLPENKVVIVKPKYAAVIRAAYDETMPVRSDDAAHAMRIKARADILIKELAHET
ncbi:MAG: hypothetical protein AAF429_11110 [Pseudomonadota bacterium]